MTDYLVKRLRSSVNELYGRPTCGLMNAAADRIEQLEREVRYLNAYSLNLVREFNVNIEDMQKLRAALHKIAQHDLQAIAMDALRQGERVPLELQDD